jgi:histidyl-tRNA synthetase
MLLQQLQPQREPRLDFYLVSRGEQAEAQALLLAQQLRQAGFAVDLDISGSAFGKQFKRADRSGAPACLVLGDAEAASGTVQLKWLASGAQRAIAQAELVADVAGWRQQLQAAQAAGISATS